ncbi:MAG: Membrane protein related to metalloendopeptidase, partial [Frankiales bacterium]|nr:Membrane protein related to metalloendopeptidase [Frankiales bacterium]
AALASTQESLAVARAREARIAVAESIARTRAGIPAAAIDGAFTARPLAECKGGTTSGYPNGQIPTAALCPLWGTSGQMLRADAAAAFDAMSHAYAEVFSAPICVTDSYRDYPSQVAVAAAKPTLAAVPGTSNHGWGVAVDLCDGIQSFSSAQHQWMQANSMAYGWFHPAWAQAGGSKPEAWHWEFAG